MRKLLWLLVSAVLVVPASPVAPATASSAASTLVTAAPAATPAPSQSWATPQQKACLNGVQSNGHRGLGPKTVRSGGRRYTENTLQSFARAMALGMCGFETDLRSTRGGCVSLMHDATLQRTTNGRGKIARKLCGYVARRKTPSGARVPTAYQAIDLMARSRTGFALFELKRGATSAAQVKAVIAYANRKLRSPQLLRFTSGDVSMLNLVKSIDKRYPTGRIHFGAYDRPNLSTVPKNVDMLMLDARALNASYVKAAHDRGIEVSARKVDSAAAHSRVKSFGVDNVVSDRPSGLGARR